jgi:general L-amino acid transport system permease protein
MSGAAIDPRLVPARTAPRKALQLSWSDPRFRNIVWQVVILGTLAAIVWYLVHNTQQNLAARHIATGFGFLGLTASMPIGEHLIPYESSVSTWGRALVIGVLNTFKVAVVGVVLATLWGTLVGIARLSKNWLIAKLAATYVEVLRDIPVLLQLFFWYGLLQALPVPKVAFAPPADGSPVPLSTLHPLPGVFLSNRGLQVPVLEWEQAHWAALAALAAGILGTMAWSRIARRRQDATGVRPLVWPVAAALVVGLPVAVWAVMGAPFTLEMPVPGRFNLTGGTTLISPEYGALTFGLMLYTAAYIAEIVRSGILAVPTGQWEAAGALGLRPGRVLRQVVLPQALRVIIPPMTSQYLNLTKNSSLAVAIGYQDVTSVANTTLNQTGQAVEGIAVLMAVYLVISLGISLAMNRYNARKALVER